MESILFEILKKCEGLHVQQEREVAEKHIELIIGRNDMTEWMNRFAQEVGEPAKNEGEKPTEEHLQMTEPYGGINKFQVLFHKATDQGEVIIMFWPWGDDEHVTLHMVLQ